MTDKKVEELARDLIANCTFEEVARMILSRESALEAKLEKAIETLTHYAEKGNHEKHPVGYDLESWIDRDHGKIARQTLKEIGN